MTKIPNDIGVYDEKMKTFGEMEEKALGIYNFPENTSKQILLSVIKDTGIYYWHKSIQLLKSINELKLPLPLCDKAEKITQYCELRIKTYELLYKATEENTEKYAGEIQKYDTQIAEILDLFHN